MSVTGAQLIAAVAVTGADQAATQLLGVGTSADLAQTSLLTTSSAAGALSPFLDALGSQAFSTGVGFNGLTDSSSRMTVALADTADVTSKWAASLSAVQPVADANTVSLTALADVADKNTMSLSGLATAADADTTALTSTAAAADASTASFTASSSAALKNATSFDIMGAASKAASGTLDILGKVGSFAFDALKTGAEAVTVVGVAATFLAGKFEVEMTKLYTTAGELHSNLKMVGSGILDMASQVGIGALKLGDAMYWIESGGAHGAAGLTDLKIAAEGAKAENSNLDDVAKALMGTLNAFRGTGLDAATAMNVLIASTANGMMTLQDLSNAMSNVSPAAAKFGISVIDIGAGLATMTAQGDSAEQAATHLRQVILALESPAAAGAKAIKSIGLTTQEVSDAMRKSLPGAIEMITTDLAKKFPEGSTAYNEAIKNIAGGNKQLLALLETSGASMKTYKDNVKNISDAVKQGGKDVMGWADVQKNFNTIMDEAGAAIESLFIKIGTALLPVLSQLFQQVSPTISAFSTWIDKSGVLSGITQTLSGWVGKLGEAFNYVADAFNQVFTRGSGALDTFDRASAIVSHVGDAFTNVNKALSPLADTFDRAKSVIADTTKATAPLADTFDRANGIIKSTTGTVKDAPNAWLPFWNFIKNVREGIAAINWGAIGAGISNIGQAIGKMDWGKVGAFFSGIVQSIQRVDWGKVGKDIEKIATGFTQVDWGKVGTAISGITNSLLHVDWGKIGADIKALLDNLSQVDWKSTLQGFTDVINGIKGVVQFFTFFENALTFVANFTDFIVKQIVKFFQWLYDKLVGHSIIPDLINSIVSWFASLPGKLAGVITGTVGKIVAWFGELPGKLQTLITTLVSNIASWWGDLPGKIGAFAGSIISNLVSPFQSAQNTISGIVGTIGGWISSLLGQIGSVGPAAAAARPPGFASGIENFGGGLAYVHAGEVLTYLPPGTSVTPASRVSSGALGGGQPVQVNINIAGHRVAQTLLPDIVQAVRSHTGVRF